MSTAFGVKSNCIQEGDNEFRYWGKKIFEFHPFWIALAIFMPQILNFFSIPLNKRDIREFFMKTFRDNVEYRQSHNIIKHDFMNLLIQLMEKGYIESDDMRDIDKSCKYLYNCFKYLFSIALILFFKINFVFKHNTYNSYFN